MALLDPVLEPLLGMQPIWLILACGFVLTVIITLIYKYTTDQDRVKYLRTESKKLQKELRSKELQENKELLGEKQKQLSTYSMEMMKSNFKPMMFTMIPVLLVLGWLTGHLAFDPLMPDEFFTVDVYAAKGYTGVVSLYNDDLFIEDNTRQIVDGKARFKIRAVEEGRYILGFKADDTLFEKSVRITKKLEYESPIQTYDGVVERIEVQHDKLLPLGENVNIFGWHPGWLGTYIFFSIFMSMIIRKLMGVQ